MKMLGNKIYSFEEYTPVNPCTLVPNSPHDEKNMSHIFFIM